MIEGAIGLLASASYAGVSVDHAFADMAFQFTEIQGASWTALSI
jgi:hypothetical protein